MDELQELVDKMHERFGISAALQIGVFAEIDGDISYYAEIIDFSNGAELLCANMALGADTVSEAISYTLDEIDKEDGGG